jgi:catechol 2,3-dioxygenase-like lactoylglutathione lyase family enzyme
MPARVKGLGHVGLYVRDLEGMKEFWGGFMGMTLTKCNENVAFYSADPEAVDHEIALMRGSRPAGDPHLVQQISMRVDKLDDVRDFHRRAKARGYRIDRVVTHGSAIGCYFRDPEDNPVEVFWLTGRTSWAVIAVPVDIERSNDELMAESDRVWGVSGKVEMGVAPQGELERALRDLNAKTAAAPVS